MLTLFKKKTQETKIIDSVVISEAAKLQAMLIQWEKDKNIAFLFWFDDSLRSAESFFAAQTIEPVCLLSTKNAGTATIGDKLVVFAEHYPLYTKEEELYQKLNLRSVQVYSALNEPLLLRFGGEKIGQLMGKLGLQEDAVIEHKMISRSIRDMQDKMEKKIVIDQLATSQADWLQKNYID
ncbi:MAG: hypothetical protein ABI688_00410 [Bacteroidota bacterium]